jgi:hypothetical protein
MLKRILFLTVISLLLFVSNSFASLTDGLIAYWSFDNCDATDDSGYGNNGTIYGDPQCLLGTRGKAFSFDGQNDYVTIPDSSSQQISTNQLTVSAWIQLGDNVGFTQWRIVEKQQTDRISWGLEIFGNGYGGATGNNITFHDSNGSSWVNCTAKEISLTADTWYNVTATDSNGLIRIYVNGTFVKECSNGLGILPNINSPIEIGKHYAYEAFYFNGILDDILIYDRALTEKEIQALVKGPAIKPKIAASPMSVNLGSVKVGSMSSPKTVTIKNTGSGALVINSINITGPNQSEFNQTNSCSTIPAKNSCPITVTLNPTVPFGNKNAIMSILSNDPKNPTINVKLSGQAPPPAIAISPTSVNFGSVGVGSTSAPKIVTIKNTGTSDLTVNAIIFAGTNAGDFGHTNNCTVVAKGNSCAISVQFSPTSTGSENAMINIFSNDPNPKKAVINVKLSGRGK